MQILLIVVLVALLSSCNQGTMEKHHSTFQQDWDSSYNQYQLILKANPFNREHSPWNPSIRDSHSYVTVPIAVPEMYTLLSLTKDIQYKRISSYVESISTEDSKILRIINAVQDDFCPVKYLQGKDTIHYPIGSAIKDTFLLFNYCWLVQEQDDSLRYIYYDDIRKGAESQIIDTTVYSRDGFVDDLRFLIDVPVERVTREYPLVVHRSPYHMYFERLGGWDGGFWVNLSYWERGKFAYLHLPAVWKYDSCGDTRMGSRRDSVFVQKMIQHLCFVKSHGGFQDGFIFTSGDDPARQKVIQEHMRELERRQGQKH